MTRRTFVTLPAVLLTGLDVTAAPVEVKGMLGGPDIEGGYFELQARNGNSAHEVIVMTPNRFPLVSATPRVSRAGCRGGGDPD